LSTWPPPSPASPASPDVVAVAVSLAAYEHAYCEGWSWEELEELALAPGEVACSPDLPLVEDLM